MKLKIKALISLLEFADALNDDLKASPSLTATHRADAVSRIRLLFDDAVGDLEAIRSSDIGEVGNVEGERAPTPPQ